MRIDLALDDEEIKRILDSRDQSERVTAAVQTVLTRRLIESLKAHASALKDAATASDKYAGRLVWATWALVLATAVLVLVAWHRP